MKFLLALSALVSLSLASAHDADIPHLDLEMSSAEYRQHLAKSFHKELTNDQPPIAQSLRWGDRLSKWLAHENARRSSSEALRLSNPNQRGGGIPIDRPSVYSIATIGENIQLLRKELSPAVLAVLDGAAFPAQLPVSDEDFIKEARRVDRNYQTAARVKSLMPWMSHYRSAKSKDVRGYHFFSTQGWSAERVDRLSELSETEQQQVITHLVGMCLNNNAQTLDRCRARVQREREAGRLGALYTELFAFSARVWRNFFDIPSSAVRSDVNHRDPKRMVVPFNTPSVERFIPYLKDNVEDEFRFGDWSLVINFGRFLNGPRLTFKPGVVPHVTGLGGNEIVMDSNQPIEEFDSQWTIRHEFGHVIGLPDCYHEFYDDEQQAFVNYQLDVTDLMCSRAGNMNERIARELQRVYRR